MSKKTSIVEDLKYIRITSDIKKIYQQLGEEKAIEYVNNLSEDQIKMILEKERVPGAGEAAGGIGAFFRRLLGVNQPNYTPRPLEGEILSPPKPGEASTQMKDVTPPKTGALTAVDQVSDVPSFAKKNNSALKTAAGVAAGTGAVYGANELMKDKTPADTTSDFQMGNPAGDFNPGQKDSVPTAVEPAPKEEPAPKAEPKKEFEFTDAEKQGKVSKERMKQWASHVGIEDPDVTWEKYGRNLMNDAKKQGGSLSMKNTPAPTETQKKGQAAVKKAYGLGESLLDAFNKVVGSKHPNLFQEAAKGSEPKNEKEKKLAALAEPKDKITHKDVLVGRGVVKEDEQLDEAGKEKLEIYRDMAGDNASEIGDDIHYMRNAKTGYGSKEQIAKARTKLKKREAGMKLASKKIAGKGVKVPATESYEFEDEQLEEGKKKYSDAKPKMYSDTMKAATKFKDSDVSKMIRDEKARKASMKEDTNLFSAEELAFFEAIAPTPEDHAPQGGIKKKADGSKSGTLSDEYVMDKSVVGKGTITYKDPKTGKIKDYISPVTLNNPHMQASQDEFKVPNPIPVPKPRPKNLGEAKNSEDNEPIATGANKLHMNVKKAADYNTPNVKHTFENGEQVTLTRGMAGDFLARHSSAKTANDKDAILKHANKSLEAFKAVARGAKVPSEKETSAKPKVSLGSMKGK